MTGLALVLEPRTNLIGVVGKSKAMEETGVKMLTKVAGRYICTRMEDMSNILKKERA